jgi:serine/threonine protein kinase
VAHRDIKPSNVLVRDGRVYLIDVAFATVRPTPWRQAVDLANVMLTLALVSGPDRVYWRAVLQFTPEEIAEAFAACRSITIPSQLRARLRRDERDLIGDFRRLAPPREPVRIQLWSVHRALVLLALLAAVVVGAALVYAYARVAGLL